MMREKFKMNREKKLYLKPEMDIIDMAYEPNVLQACSDCGQEENPVVESEYEG